MDEVLGFIVLFGSAIGTVARVGDSSYEHVYQTVCIVLGAFTLCVFTVADIVALLQTMRHSRLHCCLWKLWKFHTLPSILRLPQRLSDPGRDAGESVLPLQPSGEKTVFRIFECTLPSSLDQSLQVV